MYYVSKQKCKKTIYLIIPLKECICKYDNLNPEHLFVSSIARKRRNNGPLTYTTISSLQFCVLNLLNVECK